MQTFYIDFEGYCEIVAKSEEDATTKFWQLIHDDEPLPNNIYHFLGVDEKDE